jgi:hypothetical protein
METPGQFCVEINTLGNKKLRVRKKKKVQSPLLQSKKRVPLFSRIGLDEAKQWCLLQNPRMQPNFVLPIAEKKSARVLQIKA